MRITLLTWLNRIVYLLTVYPFLVGCFKKFYLESDYTSEYFLFTFLMLFFLGVFQLISIIYCYRKYTKVIGGSVKVLKRHIVMVLIYFCAAIISCIISYNFHTNQHPLTKDYNDIFSPIFLMGLPLLLGGHFTYYLEILKKELLNFQ